MLTTRRVSRPYYIAIFRSKLLPKQRRLRHSSHVVFISQLRANDVFSNEMDSCIIVRSRKDFNNTDYEI